ncbi:MAG: alcohol dehydrogenase, partial [Myxococcaceae bacterium]|nr:alcohol dehydrogenase [Myxococcaceae bacterium]
MLASVVGSPIEGNGEASSNGSPLDGGGSYERRTDPKASRAGHCSRSGEYVELPEPDPPGANEVLVGVELSPINPNDLMLARGIYALHPKLPTV